MLVYKDFIYSYGYDMRLAKYNYKTKQLDAFIELPECRMTAMKLLKASTGEEKSRLAVAFLSGEVALYDLALN